MFFNCVNIHINLTPNRMCDECTNKESVIIMNIRGNDLYLCKDCYEKLHNEMSNRLEDLKNVIREYTSNFKEIKGFMYSRPIDDYEGSI